MKLSKKEVDLLKRVLFFTFFIVVLMLTSCNSKDKDEIRRLAGENIKARQELMELKSERDKLKAENTGLQESLELSRLSQEELCKEMSKTHMELLYKVNKKENFQQLIKTYAAYLTGEYEENYGGMIYLRVQTEGMDKFISLLSKEHIYKIDKITTALVRYVEKNDKSDSLNKIIHEYENEKKIVIYNNEFYILLRLIRLMQP